MHGENGDRAKGASSMGSSLGRRCRASWGARPWHPGLTSGSAGSRLRRAHAGGGSAASSVILRFALASQSPNRWRSFPWLSALLRQIGPSKSSTKDTKHCRKGHEGKPSRRQGLRACGPRSPATGQGGSGWNGSLGPQPTAAPLGMPAVGQGAFVHCLRPQGALVSFVVVFIIASGR